MKKLILILLTVFLLGSMSRENWDKGTPQQQKDLLSYLAQQFAPTISCQKGTMYAVGEDNVVYLFFDCEDKNEEI